MMNVKPVFFLLGCLFTGTLAASFEQVVLAATTAPNWQYYYDADANQHQSNSSALSSQGYRPISLSLYGQPPNERYAAVWVQRPNPAFTSFADTNSTGYQAFIQKWSQQGYVPTIVSVTGPSSSAKFSGVAEQNGVTNWYQKCDLTRSQYDAELTNATNTRYMLKSFTEYGNGTDPDRRFCGVWYYNDQFDKFTYFVDQDQSRGEQQTTFNAEITKPHWRPLYFSVSEDHLYSTTYGDLDYAQLGMQIGMSAAVLVSVNEAQKAMNRYIIHLQGGGTGSNTQFSAVWALNDIPTPRTWQVNGTVTGFQNNTAASEQADAMMESFMKVNGVRQAQFTVGKNGNILLQKAYSWTEATLHFTAVDDVFLLASVSKMFLNAAIQKLYDSPGRKLTPCTKVYPLLGYTNTTDPRLQEITVDQLLTHSGGLNVSKSGFDASYSMRQIAIAENLGANPATTKNVVDYMSKYTLDYDPGAGSAYSNYGYLLLSYVVENITGMGYYDYLSSAVLGPGGYDVRRWPTSPSAHANDAIIQESKGTGLNAAQPQSPYLIADVFGGDGMYKEDCYGTASLAASATTLVKFAHSHAVGGIGGRVEGTGRSGSTPGTSTYVESTSGDIDFSVVVNTRDFPLSPGDPFFHGLISVTMRAFLSANLAL